MNAKFFDLKKEKQDRMINAALKIFAENGYSHASTDDIVREARISKGLLFHYFESKIGVYSFLCDYCIKYYSIELSSAVDPSETNYFTIRKQVEAAKSRALKTYPYLFFFINTCEKERTPEALIVLEESKAKYDEILNTVYGKIDLAPIQANPKAEQLFKMLDSTLNAVMEGHLRDGSFNAEMLLDENLGYIDIIEKMF